MAAKKGKSFAFTIVTLISVIFVIALIFGGTFYIIVHNNINGLGERYRSSIQNIPLLKLALPVAPDPLDPKYLTEKEIRDKYTEFRKLNADLQGKLDQATKTIQDLQKYKNDGEAAKAANDKANADIKTKQAELDAKQAELDNLKKTIDNLIASGNKDGLKQYFETVSPDVAKQVYADVVKQQQVDAGTKKFAQVYAAMDASAAAQIFEQMGKSQTDMIASTLHAMQNENSAAILAAMTPDFAAAVTQKLNELYKTPN